MTPGERIAERVTAIRREKRMSRGDFARRCGTTTYRIGRTLASHDPKLSMLIRIAEGLGVTLAELVAGMEVDR